MCRVFPGLVALRLLDMIELVSKIMQDRPLAVIDTRRLLERIPYNVPLR
jgi:hypothetical protein